MSTSPKQLVAEQFRRLTGIKPETFEKMVKIIKTADQYDKRRGGRNKKLSIEAQLLMSLAYLREYRTYFHIGQSCGVSEISAYKTVRWIEETLVKHPDFRLPGKKALVKTDSAYQIILIEATESAIGWPKKAKKLLFRKEKKTHYKDTTCIRYGA